MLSLLNSVVAGSAPVAGSECPICIVLLNTRVDRVGIMLHFTEAKSLAQHCQASPCNVITMVIPENWLFHLQTTKFRFPSTQRVLKEGTLAWYQEVREWFADASLANTGLQ